ncbi:unnamed protein product [Caenorhabditis auriculariae]|uniref:Uncharacterized protein n=1 Tax=Caenorhabditis auriculariae TaxID=2777116 RepID=A0A8S1H7S2_9PELO|nr:unnamed protein product [Caenorhabditis auriculariae]
MPLRSTIDSESPEEWLERRAREAGRPLNRRPPEPRRRAPSPIREEETTLTRLAETVAMMKRDQKTVPSTLSSLLVNSNVSSAAATGKETHNEGNALNRVESYINVMQSLIPPDQSSAAMHPLKDEGKITGSGKRSHYEAALSTVPMSLTPVSSSEETSRPGTETSTVLSLSKKEEKEIRKRELQRQREMKRQAKRAKKEESREKISNNSENQVKLDAVAVKRTRKNVKTSKSKMKDFKLRKEGFPSAFVAYSRGEKIAIIERPCLGKWKKPVNNNIKIIKLKRFFHHNVKIYLRKKSVMSLQDRVRLANRIIINLLGNRPRFYSLNLKKVFFSSEGFGGVYANVVLAKVLQSKSKVMRFARRMTQIKHLKPQNHADLGPPFQINIQGHIQRIYNKPEPKPRLVDCSEMVETNEAGKSESQISLIDILSRVLKQPAVQEVENRFSTTIKIPAEVMQKHMARKNTLNMILNAYGPYESGASGSLASQFMNTLSGASGITSQVAYEAEKGVEQTAQFPATGPPGVMGNISACFFADSERTPTSNGVSSQTTSAASQKYMMANLLKPEGTAVGQLFDPQSQQGEKSIEIPVKEVLQNLLMKDELGRPVFPRSEREKEQETMNKILGILQNYGAANEKDKRPEEFLQPNGGEQHAWTNNQLKEQSQQELRLKQGPQKKQPQEKKPKDAPRRRYQKRQKKEETQGVQPNLEAQRENFNMLWQMQMQMQEQQIRRQQMPVQPLGQFVQPVTPPVPNYTPKIMITPSHLLSAQKERLARLQNIQAFQMQSQTQTPPMFLGLPFATDQSNTIAYPFQNQNHSNNWNVQNPLNAYSPEVVRLFQELTGTTFVPPVFPNVAPMPPTPPQPQRFIPHNDLIANRMHTVPSPVLLVQPYEEHQITVREQIRNPAPNIENQAQFGFPPSSSGLNFFNCWFLLFILFNPN